jgi:hypothetical protein
MADGSGMLWSLFCLFGVSYILFIMYRLNVVTLLFLCVYILVVLFFMDNPFTTCFMLPPYNYMTGDYLPHVEHELKCYTSNSTAIRNNPLEQPIRTTH